jgi:Tetratricopeptide repeat
LQQLGDISRTEGNFTEAARLYREAVSIFEEISSPTSKKAREALARIEEKI